MTTNQTERVSDEELDQMILKLERDGMTPKQLSLMRELREVRRAKGEPELNPANLVNKFYERYPVASFKSDTERAAALGYFMAGAELQCFGEFVKYEDLYSDE